MKEIKNVYVAIFKGLQILKINLIIFVLFFSFLGKAVSGSYTVHLPDGRIQTVTYTADHYNGYVADVSYTGEAVYPKYEPKPYKPAPAYKPAPPPPAYKPAA